MLLSVKEYAAQKGVSVSTVQRRLSRGELRGRKLGRAWFVEVPLTSGAVADDFLDDQTEGQHPLAVLNVPESDRSPVVKDLIGFSAKALNSYLLMSDRLLEEKERAFAEKLEELNHQKQRLAELEAYIKILENLLFSGRSPKSKGMLPEVTKPLDV